MFETEVTHVVLGPGTLPAEVCNQFRAPNAITHLGLIKWEEHCTECAWPACYTTCDLYNPRNDGNCRRTIDGFSPLSDVPVFGGHVVRMRFKRWGTLTARCRLDLQAVDHVVQAERHLNLLSDVANRFPRLGTAIGRPGLAARAVRRLKDRSVNVSRRAGSETKKPNCFILEIHNPNADAVELSLDIAALNRGPSYVPFKRLLRVAPGFQRIRIPFTEIERHLVDAQQAYLGLNPNLMTAEQEGLTLYFGAATFAFDPTFAPEQRADPANGVAETKTKTKKVKVAIWDLDNTVWNGTLIEDGPGSVTLKPGIRELIVALDSRGIVNSIASKNHEGPALAEVERLGLRDYFVFPMISWGPKSEAVRQITEAFNVGEDTIAFIDDQAFERAEVKAGNPKVRVYAADDVPELLAREEFNVPVTEEARNRRSFYQTEEVRKRAMEQSLGGYIDFLKQSNIRVQIAPAAVGQIERIHELVQRTNQMNFSGNRYTKPDLLATLSNRELECFVIDAEDNYGKYGSVGFVVVKIGAVPRVIDLAFSCRVQSKRVEHAVLTYLMERFAAFGATCVEVFYRASDRNFQVAQVFGDLGCREKSRQGSDSIYERDITGRLPENDIVTVIGSDGAQPPLVPSDSVASSPQLTPIARA